MPYDFETKKYESSVVDTFVEFKRYEDVMFLEDALLAIYREQEYKPDF